VHLVECREPDHAPALPGPARDTALPARFPAAGSPAAAGGCRLTATVVAEYESDLDEGPPPRPPPPARFNGTAQAAAAGAPAGGAALPGGEGWAEGGEVVAVGRRRGRRLGLGGGFGASLVRAAARAARTQTVRGGGGRWGRGVAGICAPSLSPSVAGISAVGGPRSGGDREGT
jgi:hypothetical protein